MDILSAYDFNEFPDWLNEQELSRINEKELRMKMLRYKYCQHILQTLIDNATKTIELPAFSEDNMTWDEIMNIGTELYGRFNYLYIKTECHNAYVLFDIIEKYSYADNIIPLNFMIELKN